MGDVAGTRGVMRDAQHPALWLQQRQDQQSFMFWMLRMLPLPQPFWGGPQDSLFAALHELDQVGEEHIPVALTEAVHIIGDLGAGIIESKNHFSWKRLLR